MDEVKMIIDEDGGITLESDKISGKNHTIFEQLFQFVNKMMGGTMKRERRARGKAHVHTHTNEHNHEHQLNK